VNFDPFPEPLPREPLEILERWLEEAVASLGADHRNPTAMTLATCGADQVPDARVVLCRGFDASRGVLTYFTDRSSAKGRQQQENPRAAVVFYWESLYRQVRAAGPVVWASDAISDAYFATRMPAAQASASCSHQSQPLATRAELEARQQECISMLGEAETPLPRPERWGGVHIWIERLEFWTGRTDRLHDRVVYRRQLRRTGGERSGGTTGREFRHAEAEHSASTGSATQGIEFEGSDWTVQRLQP